MDMRKRLNKSLWAGAAALLVAAASATLPARADDTEIYLTPPTATANEPLVMLSLDYRDNLGSTICNNTAAGACDASDFFRDAGMAADLPVSGTLNFFEMLRLTLKLVLGEVSGVKIGLMLNHNNQNNAEGPTHGTGATGGDRKSNGGYIARRFRSINEGDSLAELIGIMDSMPVPATGGGQSYQGRELFFELYRYLKGGLIYNGHNGWTDYNTDNTQNLNTDGNSHDWDSHVDIETAGNTQYIAPAFDNCTKIFTINFMFLVANQEDDSNTAIAAAAPSGLGLSNRSPDPFSPMLGALHDLDLSTEPGVQNVTSYFFVDPTKINTTTRRYASSGGTREPFALTADPEQLVRDLRNVFSQILSVSTTFVAASIPVNVFNRSQAVDNIYLALFQAEEEPIWNGDLKKLRAKRAVFADGSQGTVLVDSLNNFDLASDNASAFGADGRIRNDALTFWSDSAGTLMDVGDSNSDGQVDTVDGSNNPANPEDVITDRDGRFVDRGGAGQKTPGFYTSSAGPGASNPSGTTPPVLGGPRKLFYDSAASSLAALNADTATATALSTTLGVADGTPALNLLKWIRGMDVGPDDASPDTDGDGSSTDARPWLFGDPMHSRPTPINYGNISGYPSTRRPGIFIALGSNDGFLRFIENTDPGESTPATGNAEPLSTQSGKELWAFMPQAAMPVQKFLRANAPLLTDSAHPNYDPDFPSRPFSPHPYAVDGAPTVLVKDYDGDGTIENNADPTPDDKVYLYFGMRRGGRNYYGLDVTDPYNPVLMWTIAGGTGDFTELARTFSQPRAGKVRVGTVLKDVLIFTGGYSNNKDFKALGTDDTVGNAIYVVDALTGALVWKATGNNMLPAPTASSTHFVHASLVDSIPSNPTVIDTDGDSEGLIDRIVVGDSGGNVWRADLGGSNTANWKLTLLASLGRHFQNDIVNDRRFTNPPDFVQDRDDLGPYDAVILGSGDREDPLDLRGQTPDPDVADEVTQNWFYVIKDRNIDVGAGANSTLDHDDAGLPDITDVCVPSGTDTAVPCNTASRSSGWKLQLAEAEGEKNLASALTISGTIFFTTYLKAGSSEAGTCGPAEGNGLLYAVNLDNGAPAYNYDLDDGSAGDNAGHDGDRTNELASGGIPSQVVYLPPLPPCVGVGCPPPPPPEEECPGGGDIVLPDGSVQRVCPLAPKPTFWRRREE